MPPAGPRTWPRLVLATRNPGKVREITAIYARYADALCSLDAWPDLRDLPEDEETYAANAVAKAEAVLGATGLPALADDSGIEIDALGGAPGVRSRRLLGEAAADADRNAHVLALLAGVAEARRTARFRALVAVAAPGAAVRTFEGVCEGRIAAAPRGGGGFGYDPIFEIAGLGRTMAEAGPDLKNRISHRARALRAAEAYVAALLGRDAGGGAGALRQ